jgi:hypothetical protein
MYKVVLSYAKPLPTTFKRKDKVMEQKEKEKIRELDKKLEIKRYRSFQVEVVNNGFIATIGCQRFVFKTLLEVADALKEYWDSPSKTEAKYLGDSLVYSNCAQADSGTALVNRASSVDWATTNLLRR